MFVIPVPGLSAPLASFMFMLLSFVLSVLFVASTMPILKSFA